MSNLGVVLASFRMRLLVISRYKGQLIMDSIAPIIMAAMPILIGRATGGDNAAAAFEANTGTANYIGFMLIGSSVFSVVSMAFWHIANWLRWEMQTGTLEALYLAPTERIWVAGGTILYSLGRSIFAALTLRVKETASTLANIGQFAFMILCASFFPFAALPEPVLAISRWIPLAYSVDAFRSTLMGYPPGFPELAPIETEILIVVIFGALMPILGYWLYRRAEDNARRSGSLGEY
jgi:ABC-2 type transport system permease protein